MTVSFSITIDVVFDDKLAASAVFRWRLKSQHSLQLPQIRDFPDEETVRAVPALLLQRMQQQGGRWAQGEPAHQSLACGVTRVAGRCACIAGS